MVTGGERGCGEGNVGKWAQMYGNGRKLDLGGEHSYQIIMSYT